MEERALHIKVSSQATQASNVCSMHDAFNFEQSVLSLPVKYSSEKKKNKQKQNTGESKAKTKSRIIYRVESLYKVYMLLTRKSSTTT